MFLYTRMSAVKIGEFSWDHWRGLKNTLATGIFSCLMNDSPPKLQCRKWYPVCCRRTCWLYITLCRGFAERHGLGEESWRNQPLDCVSRLIGCVPDSQKGSTVGRSFSLSWRSHPDVAVAEPMRFRSATTSGAPGVEKARNVVRQKATGKRKS